MGAGQGIYAFVAFIGIFLGIVLFFIDGMILWSAAFFSFGLFLIILKLMWGFAGWADNVTRKLGDSR